MTEFMQTDAEFEEGQALCPMCDGSGFQATRDWNVIKCSLCLGDGFVPLPWVAVSDGESIRIKPEFQ